MTDAELIELIRHMRKAQRDWFSLKRKADLMTAKRLETEVDNEIAKRDGRRAQRQETLL